MNDQQLLAAYLQGDLGALETLVRTYYRLVVATATRATGDAHLALDITQTVFLIFVRKARRVSHEVSLPGWFLRTARFVARDALKKLARRSHYEVAAGAQWRDLKEAHPLDAGVAQLLTEAILALSPKEQVCVVARFYDDRTVAEIAQDHGLSHDAVEKRIERGLEKMRSFFGRRGFPMATNVVPSLFAAGFPPGTEAQAVQSVLGGIHAAQTAGPPTTNLLHANQLLAEISRRELLSVGLKAAAALLATSAGALGFLAVRPPAVPNLPPFRPSGPQVEALGQAWAQVQRQVVALRVNQIPGRGVGNTTAIVRETVRISSELDALLTPATERAVLAEFLTVELRETLHLSEPQQAYVFPLIRERLAGSDSLLAAMKATLAVKTPTAQSGEGREKAQKAQKKSVLRLLCVFAANPECCRAFIGARICNWMSPGVRIGQMLVVSWLAGMLLAPTIVASRTLVQSPPPPSSPIPSGLSNVVAIGGRGTPSVALIRAPDEPFIKEHPQSRRLPAGSPVSFRVTAVARQALSYQWQFNGVDLRGATQEVLALKVAWPAQAGHYRARATAAGLTITSRGALLGITPP